MVARAKKNISDRKENRHESKALFTEVQKEAYHLWEKEGKPQGRDWEMWIKAEKEVLGK
ncbi:MAG: DUF2934 domain-containing protein [Candidatus Omnitrophica bacterium]|jgi:hypothetical protein|nr:DUF2934 domain-containing protein [Candidatus Omnitrophota bacterium]MDD3987847.1 DUF2934 domain-containing protein [Candidatus Omnitrophota bacterium]